MLGLVAGTVTVLSFGSLRVDIFSAELVLGQANG